MLIPPFLFLSLCFSSLLSCDVWQDSRYNADGQMAAGPRLGHTPRRCSGRDCAIEEQRENPVMQKNVRRRFIKGVAIALPAAWARPVVETVVLPAHAQTSPPCSADADCYTVGDNSFLWPGGTGPFFVSVYTNTTCDGSSIEVETVVASSLEEATALLDSSATPTMLPESDPPPPDGCFFFDVG